MGDAFSITPSAPASKASSGSRSAAAPITGTAAPGFASRGSATGSEPSPSGNPRSTIATPMPERCSPYLAGEPACAATSVSGRRRSTETKAPRNLSLSSTTRTRSAPILPFAGNPLGAVILRRGTKEAGAPSLSPDP